MTAALTLSLSEILKRIDEAPPLDPERIQHAKNVFNNQMQFAKYERWRRIILEGKIIYPRLF